MSQKSNRLIRDFTFAQNSNSPYQLTREWYGEAKREYKKMNRNERATLNKEMREYVSSNRKLVIEGKKHYVEDIAREKKKLLEDIRKKREFIYSALADAKKKGRKTRLKKTRGETIIEVE